MRKTAFILLACFGFILAEARTLIVYYSYTNNVHTIVSELNTLIKADVVRVEPAEKGLDYAADNYAIGSAQIAAIRSNPDAASSYPPIDPVSERMDAYDTVIIATPLWWSDMAAPMQTFLFRHGEEMAGKNVGLIVSSVSSGISGVEEDARRLVPGGLFLSQSLWIRSAQTSNASTLLNAWLDAIGYDGLAGVDSVTREIRDDYGVWSLAGTRLPEGGKLWPGIYILNGRKQVISR